LRAIQGAHRSLHHGHRGRAERDRDVDRRATAAAVLRVARSSADEDVGL
ncbi:MAG: hypothetical protein AVDCRST_MAG40-954, partial [uncultured Gemmatimonadaceae bacterium]